MEIALEDGEYDVDGSAVNRRHGRSKDRGNKYPRSRPNRRTEVGTRVDDCCPLARMLDKNCHVMLYVNIAVRQRILAHAERAGSLAGHGLITVCGHPLHQPSSAEGFNTKAAAGEPGRRLFC